MSTPAWVPLAAGQVMFNSRGAWAAGTSYLPGDVVTSGGVQFVATVPSIGQQPPAAAYFPPLVASRWLSSQGGAMVWDSPAGKYTANVSGANADLTFPGGIAALTQIEVVGAGASIRSMSPGAYSGQRVLLRNASGLAPGNWFKVLHTVAGGTGAQFYGSAWANDVLFPGDTCEYEWDSANNLWIQVNRNILDPFVQWSGSGTLACPNSAWTQCNFLNTVEAAIDPSGTLSRSAAGITLPSGVNAICHMEVLLQVNAAAGDRLTSIWVGGVERVRSYRLGTLDSAGYNVVTDKQESGGQLIDGRVYMYAGGPQNMTFGRVTVRARWAGN